MKEVDIPPTISISYEQLSLIVTSHFRQRQTRTMTPVSVNSLTPASPYIINTQTDFNFYQILPTTQRLRQDLLGLSDPEFTRNGREARPKVKENDISAISRISETETSSPAASCADSTATSDRYQKIAGMIITHEALKKDRHVSHVCQQGTI